MLIQASSPRALFTLERYPKYVYIHALSVEGVSPGAVYFSGTTNPAEGTRASKALDPANVYDLHDGCTLLEYVVPFWSLFKRGTTQAPTKAIMQSTGAEGYADMRMVPFTTGGFYLNIHSAFRADRAEYQERVLGVQLVFPATGGGILRLGDSLYDLSNPTFDPYAPDPAPRKNLELQESFERAHRPTTQAIEDRRAERIRQAEAGMYPRLPTKR